MFPETLHDDEGNSTMQYLQWLRKKKKEIKGLANNYRGESFIEDECYNIIFRKKIYNSLEDLQIDVNTDLFVDCHTEISVNSVETHRVAGVYIYIYNFLSFTSLIR